MKKFDKILHGVVSIPAVIAGCFLVLLMLVTVTDVLLRAIFSKAILGSNEICVALMIVGGFLGISWAAMNDNHIKVDLLVGMLPIKIQRYFFKLNWLIVSVMSALLSIYAYSSALGVKKLNSQSELLRIPHFPQYLVVSFAYLLLCVTCLALFVRSFFTNKEPTSGESVEENNK